MRTYKMDNWGKSDCSFHIFESVSSLDEAVHTHDFIEFVYVREGGAKQNVNNIEFDVSKGDLIFINRGSTHAFSPNNSLSYYNICFAPDIETDIPLGTDAFSVLQLTVFESLRHGCEYGVVSFSGSERNEIEALLNSIYAEYKKNEDFKRAVLESYMSILLVKILRKTTSPNTQNQNWHKLSDYIDENLGADLSLSALSQKYFYNSSYFSRAFKEKFGMSLTEYIGKRRVGSAIKLLRETDLTVEEIAIKVGFPSKSAFYRVFAKVTGKPPSEYRR